MNVSYPTIPSEPIERDKIAREHPPRIGRYRVQRVLGQGSFGIVYLAHDDQLQRLVAIKIPHPHLVSRPEDAHAYLTEARTVASLDHPNIVPVYDVGSNEEHPFFLVSKYIEGTTLAQRIKDNRPSLTEAVELTATVAQTLHYAHGKGLVHRDIKPGNILLDGDGKPFVADFGLALREQDVGKGSRFVGTPAYMSPEQAKGEGHRVDGRSDLFSLGVVFYELLTGRRPFTGDSQEELLEQIKRMEVRPPRQWDDTIPKELARICLKALSKRASDRYSTGKDMADDLYHFFEQTTVDEKQSLRSHVPAAVVPSPIAPPTPVPSPLPTLNSDSSPLRIVPKGLRSFDVHDADFFLELLPGPRDREGLPDSIRFWKARIEEMDADNTFAVGLIYGPSGCGKSSLVKAGLLPRLSGNVAAVYVEAVAAETETRLLNGLRKKCPALPANLGLKETLAALRRGQGAPPGQKILIVLDQFEQWLHAGKDEENTELVQALRQCDGSRVQCIVMVRDDFWLAVSRFLRDLEIDLVPGHNIALVDLFDLDHTRKVLGAFGRAFGKLPEKSSETSQEQRDFVNQAVSGLSQENKVVCVRLALFAEMMKGRPWNPATLKEVGGAEGVGVTFLEDTFSSSTANPKHRLHQKSARAVLKALLPEAGTDLKGHMRSQQDLLDASGHASHPRDFADLLRILDSDLRLITPTDPEGNQEQGELNGVRPRSSGATYYQLTHDYLVPSLRDWLTRKQKETGRGRAELLLADRAAVWTARPENRQLPSFSQWLRIRCLTRKKNWTPPQRKMMRRATRYHAARGLVVAGCLLLLGFVGWEGNGRLQSHNLCAQLRGSTTASVPEIVKEMEPYRRWLDPLLHEAYAQAEKEKQPRKQLHASLALLPRDPGQMPYLRSRLLEGNPEEVSAICQILRDHGQQPTEDLWVLLENSTNNQDQRFRAACALALFTPKDDRWRNVSADVAGKLVTQETFEIASWTELLKPVREFLLSPLMDFLADEKRSNAEIKLIATIYGKYADNQPGGWDQLEKRLSRDDPVPANPHQVSPFLAKRRANLGITFLLNGRDKWVWPLLKHSPDPTLRSFLIEDLGPCGIEWRMLIDRLKQEKDVSAQRAILLSLGQYGLDRLSADERRELQRRFLEKLYRNDLDPGIHSAVAWLLRHWGANDRIKELDQQFIKDKGRERIHEALPNLVEAAPGESVGWYVNSQGQTMVVIAKPGKVLLGHRPQFTETRIDHSFEIGATDVTVEQFRRFREEQKQDYEYEKWFAPSKECPAIYVTWYDAAAYCNWLSRKENLEPCYEDDGKGQLKPKENLLNLSGYRLPTEVEWEYTCRANSETNYTFGQADELMVKYGWYARNSDGKTRPVGWLKPNDFGLFDMYGNVWQWCNDVLGQVGHDRVSRGIGWFADLGRRKAYRKTGEPKSMGNALGFRLARVPVAPAR